MMTEQVQRKKKLSKELQAALDALLIDFEKLQSKVDRVFELGRTEGLDDMRIGNLVREKMRGQYHESSIRRVLPETAKRDYSKNEDSIVTNDEESLKLSDLEHEINDTIEQEPEVIDQTDIPKVESSISETDPNRTFLETIAAKNKLIEELREEIAAKDKKIAELEKKLRSYEKPTKISIEQEKQDLWNKALQRRKERSEHQLE